MVLDGEDRQLFVAQAFYRAVVQVYMAHLEAVFQAVRVNGIAVVLGGDVNPAGGQLTDRVVAAAVAELELEGLSPKGAGD